ncbi:MAG: hypothetical protein HP494_09860, partial [Nitrospira sp.]|nr:hypothetical protein [Nitrospira sp.]
SPASSFAWMAGLILLALLAGGYLAWNFYTRIAEDTTKLAHLQTELDRTRSALAEREQSLTASRDDLQHHTTDLAALKNQLIQREAELDDAQTQLALRDGPPVRAPQDELGLLLRTPDVKAISMAGTTMAPPASGMFLFDAQTKKAWLYSVNLPACPDGATYQVWAIYEKPLSVGMFQVGNGETSHLFATPLPNFTNAKKFIVSLEPTGGRAEPSGPLYLSSQLP